MYKFLLTCVLALSITTAAQASLTRELPDEFYVIPHWFSFDSDIKTAEATIGTVHRRFWTLTTEYNLYDTEGHLDTTARQRFFSLGAIFDVTNSQGYAIGTVEESLFSFFPTFRILSPNRDILATATLNFWGTTYTVTRPGSNETIATFYRAYFRLKDDWTVKIIDRSAFDYDKIDASLFIIVAAFQTDIETWRRIAEQQRTVITFDKKSMDSTSANDPAVEALANELAAYSAVINPAAEPITEADCEEMIALTTPLLAAFDEETDAQTRLVEGCQSLLPLLEGESLNPKQKSTLVRMLEQRLEASKN